MGNTNTVEPNVKIFIETDRPMYTCGDMVEGVVKIVARTHLPF
jgi:hypothetical protein